MAASSRRTIRLKGGLEQDGLTGWRKVLCYMEKPGVPSKAKKSYRRRERRVLNKIDY